jgi:transcriptional regulator with XRE-family HTH domain
MWTQDYARIFGARVRSLREQQNLSQEKLGHAAGISKNAQQLLESGRSSSKHSSPPSNPRMSTLYGLAEALGVSPLELLPQHGEVRGGVHATQQLDGEPETKEREGQT